MPIFKKGIDQKEILKKGVLAGLLQTAYCLVITYLIASFQELMGSQIPGFFGSVFVLILLVISIVISALIVFGYPLKLAFQRRIREAVLTVATTLITLVVLAMVILILEVVI